MSVDEWKSLHNMFIKTEDTIQLSGHFQGMRAEFSLQAVTWGYSYDSLLRKTKSSTHKKVLFTSLKNQGHIIFVLPKRMFLGGKQSLTNVIFI